MAQQIESVANSETRSTLPVSKPMKYWTNTDVVMWLLQIDQKVFVPAAILRNISGKTLLGLKFEQLQDTMNIPKDTPPQEMQSLNTLYNHIDLMRAPTEGKVIATWGTDADNDEELGRLVAHPSGWTYEREYKEFVDYFEIFGENAIATSIEVSIKDVQDFMQLLVLVTAAIASLLTSIQMATTADEKQDGRRLSNGTNTNADSGVFGVVVDPKKVAVILKAMLLVISFFVTMTSGYIQVRSPAWKQQLAAVVEYKSIAVQLLGLFEDNLEVPLGDRLDFAAYQEQVKPLWVAINAVVIDASPNQRNAALKSIKAKDPTTWKRAFAPQEVVKRGCQVCGPGAIELSEPVDEHYDYMLMRFSGESLGEFTSSPKAFKADKANARQGLSTNAKTEGRSPWAAFIDCEGGEEESDDEEPLE